MRHGSLFNGIGGFQLAAHWMGWENVWHCEIDPFCNKVVKQHFPQSICYEDIKQFDAKQWRGSIDIISGGFPCQPFSQAGKRKGTADNRYLWPEMLRVIREVQPRFVVGENVGGLVNWDRGMVFEQVQADLEAEGYESAAFILPACGKDAPHQRDRIWFVAHAGGSRVQLNEAGIVYDIKRNNKSKARTREQQSGNTAISESGTVADAHNTRIQGRRASGDFERERENGNKFAGRHYQRDDWHQFPTQSPVCNRDDGFPGELAGITFSKWRQESIKAAGNAIVPQVAFELFKAIEATDQNANQ
jgi:DNA (cytosine-5)-methyltransferase 1